VNPVTRWLWRFGVLTVGTIVILVGLILSIPGVIGPGFLVIFGGIAILATEFEWAKRLLERIKRGAKKIKDKIAGPKKPDETS
jgi:uncharacterized protein (TIGR02611 family)